MARRVSLGRARTGAVPVRRLHRTLTHYTTAGPVTLDQLVRVGGEDRSGRLWIYTQSQAASFDGHAFVILPLQPGLDVRAVACDREGTLWVGTNGNGVFHVMPDVLRTYGEPEGLANRIVYPVMEEEPAQESPG